MFDGLRAKTAGVSSRPFGPSSALRSAAEGLSDLLAERFPTTNSAVRIILGASMIAHVGARAWKSEAAELLGTTTEILAQKSGADQGQIQTMILIARQLGLRLDVPLTRLLNGDCSVHEFGSTLSSHLRDPAFEDAPAIADLRAHLAALEGNLRADSLGVSPRQRRDGDSRATPPSL